jgi:AcrR family transcriptional regulator
LSPGERSLRADAQRNRDKVLRAAREAFAAGGYNVPLDEIAARAGVGPGTVYRHFPSKEALFEAVVGARVDDLIDDARQRGAAADPGAAFFGFLGRMGAEAAAKRDLPDAISVDGAAQEALREAFGVLLRRAQQAGAVRADVTMPDLLMLLKGLMRSLQDVPPGTVGDAQRDRVVAVVMDGLRPRTSLAAHCRSGALPQRAGLRYSSVSRATAAWVEGCGSCRRQITCTVTGGASRSGRNTTPSRRYWVVVPSGVMPMPPPAEMTASQSSTSRVSLTLGRLDPGHRAGVVVPVRGSMTRVRCGTSARLMARRVAHGSSAASAQ